MLSDAQYFRGSASTVLTDSRYRLIDIFATPTCHHFQLSNYDPILRLQLTFLLLFQFLLTGITLMLLRCWWVATCVVWLSTWWVVLSDWQLACVVGERLCVPVCTELSSSLAVSEEHVRKLQHDNKCKYCLLIGRSVCLSACLSRLTYADVTSSVAQPSSISTLT